MRRRAASCSSISRAATSCARLRTARAHRNSCRPPIPGWRHVGFLCPDPRLSSAHYLLTPPACLTLRSSQSEHRCARAGHHASGHLAHTRGAGQGIMQQLDWERTAPPPTYAAAAWLHPCPSQFPALPASSAPDFILHDSPETPNASGRQALAILQLIQHSDRTGLSRKQPPSQDAQYTIARTSITACQNCWHIPARQHASPDPVLRSYTWRSTAYPNVNKRNQLTWQATTVRCCVSRLPISCAACSLCASVLASSLRALLSASSCRS